MWEHAEHEHLLQDIKIDNKKMKDRTYDGGFIEPCPLSSLQQYSNKITAPSVQLLFFSLQKIPSN